MRGNRRCCFLRRAKLPQLRAANLSLAEEAKLALHPARPTGTLSSARWACAASRLPAILPLFQQRCPDADLTLRTMPTRQLTELVENSRWTARWFHCRPVRTAAFNAHRRLNISRFYRTTGPYRPVEGATTCFAAFPAGCFARQHGIEYRSRREHTWTSSMSAPITR